MVQNDHEHLFNLDYFNSEIHSECQTRYLTVLNQGLLISDNIYLILYCHNTKVFQRADGALLENVRHSETHKQEKYQVCS